MKPQAIFYSLAMLYPSLATALNTTAADNAADLIEFSLEDLMAMDVNITSASKRSESSFNSSTASYVLSAQDIKRSDATNVPEALATIPGVHVAKISSSEWAIGIRGLNGKFSRYLQVAIDGRSVYDPMFGGVEWDELNVELADVERIEVVRGAVSTLWGTNTVNGMINIITKTARKQQGSELNVMLANDDSSSLNWRFGTTINEQNWLSISASQQKDPGLFGHVTNHQEGDPKYRRFNLAYEHQNDKDHINVNLFLFDGKIKRIWADTRLPGASDPRTPATISEDEDKLNNAIQFSWDRTINDYLQLKTRASYNIKERTSPLFDWDTKHTDLDIELHANLGQHKLSFGSNNRHSDSLLSSNNQFAITLTPTEQTINVNSLFLYDSYQGVENWDLSAGLRYEANNLADNELQGTARVLWRGHELHRVWSAVSRANGAPSRLSASDTSLDSIYIPPSAETYFLPHIINTSVNSTQKNVRVDSVEFGYRFKPNKKFSLELAVYFNEYKNTIEGFRTTPQVNISSIGLPYLSSAILAEYNGSVETKGAELNLLWMPSNRCLIEYNGTYNDASNTEGVVIKNGQPRYRLNFDRANAKTIHTLKLKSDISDSVSITSTLRYVSSIKLLNLPSYYNMDFKVNYRASKHLSLSLGARDLGKSHIEGSREIFTADHYDIESQYYLSAKMSW